MNGPRGVLVLAEFCDFSLARQQTCRPHDKNYMILQWKVYVKWTRGFSEKWDDARTPAKFRQNEHTPGKQQSLKRLSVPFWRATITGVKDVNLF